jgi:hypothetical protein
LKFIINSLAACQSDLHACVQRASPLLAVQQPIRSLQRNPFVTGLERRLLFPLHRREGGAMNLMISLGVPAVLGAPAANVIPVAHLWTPVVRLALGLEVLWWTGALAFLVWLTRPSASDKSQPPKPKRGAKEDGADGARRLAA